MKHLICIIIMLAMVLSLFGCGTEEAEPIGEVLENQHTEESQTKESQAQESQTEESQTKKAQESDPIETTETIEENRTRKVPPSYPFGEVDNLACSSYNEYYAENCSYKEGGSVLYFGLGWRDVATDVSHFISVKNGALILTSSEPPYIITQLEPNFVNCEFIITDGYWIYGIRDRQELFRIDFHGKNYQSLYCCENGSFEYLYGIRMIYLYDHAALYFPVYQENSTILCRLYLPEMKLDVLYEADTALIVNYAAESKTEITWTELDRDLYQEAMQLKNNPDPFYQNQPEVLLMKDMSREQKIPFGKIHYLNTATGEHYSIDDYETMEYGAWPNRDSENISKNGDAWWKDFQ